MPPSKTKLFGEIAISKGLLSHEQLDLALRIQGEHRVRGAKKAIGSVMHDLGLLSLVQINAIMEEVAIERRRGSIEGYKILSKLGMGGMGSVYLAKHLGLDKLVAIKVLPPRLAENDEDLARFEREALAAGRLNHPNIVQAHDVGESNGYHYLSMEYVEGESLKALLDREGRVPEPRAVEIVEQLADALRHAWSHGIVHRDVKPANIMIASPHGIPKLLDLGLAITRREEELAITKSGVIMGTPHYLSPEQARSEEVDIRSDIYSLGMTLFHMVTGQPPYVADSAALIVSKHLTEPLPDPLELNPGLSTGLCFIISKMTAKAREDRYQTPDELLADIRDLRRLNCLPGKDWRPGLLGGPRHRVELRAPSRVPLALALVPLGILTALTALEPGVWERALDRLRRKVPPIEEVKADADRELAARGERMLAEADAFAARSPSDFDGIRKRFYEVLTEQGPNRPPGLDAASRLEALEVRMSREAQASFAKVLPRAHELTGAGKFDEAREALRDFPTRYARTPWWAILQGELRAVDDAERAARAAAATRGTAAPRTP